MSNTELFATRFLIIVVFLPGMLLSRIFDHESASDFLSKNEVQLGQWSWPLVKGEPQ